MSFVCIFSRSIYTLIKTKNKSFLIARLLEGSSDGLGGFGDGVLGEVSGELEADGGLDFSGAHGGLLVGAGKSGGLGGDLVEHILDEGVQDLDRLGGEGETLLGVLVDAVDVGVEASSVRLAVTLGHCGEKICVFEKFFERVCFCCRKGHWFKNY